MLNIIKEKLDLSPDLKKKIDWAKNYTSTSITLEKGHLIRLEPSNLAYVDPHKVIINNYTFLFFNGVDTFYVNTLNDKLDILTKQLEKENDLKNRNRFTPEKVMADRDIQRIFMRNGSDVSMFLTKWQTMTKEAKQEFIARYIESLTFEKDDRYPNGIHLIDIKLKSLFNEKVDRLSELGLSQVPIEFISNGKTVIHNVSYPLKESQVKDYMKEFKDIEGVKLHIHPTFNHSFKDMPNEVVFNLDKNDKVLKVIPIIKDIDNPEDISNKFKLGIITSTIETIKNDHNSDHNKSL